MKIENKLSISQLFAILLSSILPAAFLIMVVSEGEGAIIILPVLVGLITIITLLILNKPIGKHLTFAGLLLIITACCQVLLLEIDDDPAINVLYIAFFLLLGYSLTSILYHEKQQSFVLSNQRPVLPMMGLPVLGFGIVGLYLYLVYGIESLSETMQDWTLTDWFILLWLLLITITGLLMILQWLNSRYLMLAALGGGFVFTAGVLSEDFTYGGILLVFIPLFIFAVAITLLLFNSTIKLSSHLHSAASDDPHILDTDLWDDPTPQ